VDEEDAICLEIRLKIGEEEADGDAVVKNCVIIRGMCIFGDKTII